MSSTTPRRATGAARPRYRTPPPARRVERKQSTPEWTDDRVFATPLSRAFPLPAVNVDTLIACGIMVVTLILRLWALGDRPLHHDESLHATYSWYLMGRANPQYYYDPMMHGPLQFHMIAFFYSIFGSSPFTARLWSVMAGTALVAVPLLLWRQLGRRPTFALMGMLALSPTTLYFSRFAREDMQFSLFNFLMAVAIIRFVCDARDGMPYYFRWLYLLATAFVVAYAAKESVYLSVAIFGSLILIWLGLEFFRGGWRTGGALIAAIVRTPGRAWGLSLAIIGVIFVLLYWPIGEPASWAFIPGSNMVKTTLDIGNKTVPFSYSTDGLLGGLQYWQAQEPVARGGQPWFYYLLVIPLYEWLIVPFGIIGGIWILRRGRTFTNVFLLWWTVGSFIIYGWSSEKMPWNSLHLVVPLATLAAIGLVVSVTAWRRWVRYLAIAGAVFTGFVTVHNAYTLAYVNGANPVEYYVYVQTSPDVPVVYDEMQRLQTHLGGVMSLQVDNADTWPWVFYLRDPKRWAITAYPNTAHDYVYPNGSKTYVPLNQPVLIVDVGNYPQLSTSLAANYVAFREDLRWWNPEEYKAAYVDRLGPDGKPLSRLGRFGVFIKDALAPSTWGNIFAWEFARRPFSPHAWDNYNNQLDFYFVVRKDLVPYLSPHYQQLARQQLAIQQQQDPFLRLGRQLSPLATFTGTAGTFTAAGPIAVDAQGHVVVADPSGHRIAILGSGGTPLHVFGSAGTGAGQFNGQYSPGIGGVAVGPNGNIYATDTWNGRVEEFTPTGTFVRAWGRQNLASTKLKPADFYGPRGIAVAPNGDVYVADTGHRRIQVFTKDGAFLFGFGSAGAAAGQFEEPSSVAIDAQGRVYVADYWNSRIQEFDAHGKPVLSIPVTTWQSNSYDEPQIAVDGAGHVYAPDPVNARILVFGADGKPYAAWGMVGQFGKPLGVAVGPEHSVLVSDSGNARVLRFAAP